MHAYLLTGHLILICVPRNTVAAPPIFSVTLVFFGSCWMYVVLLAAMAGYCSSGAHGFVLHAFCVSGFLPGHSSSRRSTLCSWAMICLHSARRSLNPPPQDLSNYAVFYYFLISTTANFGTRQMEESDFFLSEAKKRKHKNFH